MKQFNKFHRMLRMAAVAVFTAAAALQSCTKVDDTLGSNLIPDNQQMKAGFASLPATAELNPKKYVETRLFQTDSIISSNITNGYMGSMLSDTLGLRTAGFLSQYISYYLIDSGYFGYRPIFDSAQILLSINSYGSDTLTEQMFEVYEVTSNDYLYKKPVASGKSVRDTSFYLNFDPTDIPYLDGAGKRIIGDKPLFSFTLGGDKGPSTTAVTMIPTAEGKEFVSRLMLQSGNRKGDYSIYSTDSLAWWVNEFQGLYIKPVTDPATLTGSSPKGSIYATTLSASGLSVYGRNRVKDDPTLIKDTIGMVYYFYDSYQSTYGNVSVNVINHDYEAATSSAKISLDEAREYNADGTLNQNRVENSRIYVEGLGGVVSEIKFTEAFFDELESLIETENAASGKSFHTMAFSQAHMSVYFPASRYDWTQIDPANPGRLIAEMGSAPSRLGLYTNYRKLTPVTDYAYVYENTYSTTLAYGGYINRSRGCYVMNITGHLQEVWNNYLKQKEAVGAIYVSQAKDPAGHAQWAEAMKNVWDKIEKRSMYLGPEAYGLFTASTTVLQGQTTDAGSTVANNAPIRFDLAYNLVK